MLSVTSAAVLLSAPIASAWIALLMTTSAAAQSVRVHAVEAETRQPAVGTIVSLVDSANHRLAQALTNESGRLMLRAPGPGRFRLRADRIGHQGIWSEPFDLQDSVAIELVMPLDPVTLPEVTVRATTSCELRADGERTAGLWQEIRKALSAGQITSADQSVELAVRRFRRYRTLAGSVVADSTVTEHRTRTSPFVSPAPATLRADGYIRETGGSFQFHGPDANTLLSPEFLESHCFDLREARNHPGQVGLAFTPSDESPRADIKGTLWVDRTSLELRRLEFEFQKIPAPVRAPGLGGQADFERLPNGSWIIRDWYIRTPQRAVIQRRGVRPFETVGQDSVVGYVDEGGTARPVGDATGSLGEAVARVRTSGGQATGDFRGRLVTPRGQPISGASIAVAESDSILTSGPDGRFEVRDLPAGRLSVRIRAIGFRPFGAAFALSSDRRLIDTTLVLQPAGQILDSVVVAGKAPVFQAGKMIDVERRMKSGFGRFLTPSQLRDPLQGGLDVQLRRFGRMRLVPLCRGIGLGAVSTTHIESPVPVFCPGQKLVGCFMAVYLDGALFWSPDMGDFAQPPDLSKFNPLDLEAVEVYRSAAELPIEYGGTNAACGVVLLWTRIGS